jgi:transposase
MGNSVESLFTAALGLQSPWEVQKVELNTIKRRIDFELTNGARRLACPACAAAEQRVHDRADKTWRHLDFFQFEAWLHAKVPRVDCAACGKTSMIEVPWARPGSGFTLLFEAFALSLCKDMPVAHAAKHLRAPAKGIWRRVRHFVDAARKLDDMSPVRVIGIDETSVKKGHEYITVVHDLHSKRLLFGVAGKDHSTVHDFVGDLREHGGKPEQIEHVCMDMSAAFAKGVREALPQAEVSYDRFHVIAMAGVAMDEVRRAEVKQSGEHVRETLAQGMPAAGAGAGHTTGEKSPKGRHSSLKSLYWAMRRNPTGWTRAQTHCMHSLQRSNLKSARAWRLKMALREVYRIGRETNDPERAMVALRQWLSWAKRSRLEPFKKLAVTIQAHLQGVLRGMLDGRSNAYVEAMNGLLQQAKTAARGFRTVRNFLAIAYLRMSKLKHLPVNPFMPAIDRNSGLHVMVW